MIKKIIFQNEGCIYCRSGFYTSHDVLTSSMNFEFSIGTNKLVGDIDSGIWGVSYLFSMYNVAVRKGFFSKPLVAIVDDQEMSLKTLSKTCCYLDEKVYPLFSKKRKTVRNLIKKGIQKSGINKTVEEICELFILDSERINRPICYTGNERFRAMAAVGYAYGKKIFCFPWLSQKMVNYYSCNLVTLLEILEKLEMIVLLPMGNK